MINQEHALSTQTRKRSKKWYFLFLSVVVFTLAIIISYPQLYYFKDTIKYKNFQVFYDQKIPDQIFPILDTVEQLIQASECYAPNLKFKIFLRSDASKYALLPFQFPDKGSGQTIPGIKNVFLYKSDCLTNTSYNHLGHARTLSSVLAHELTHVMVQNKWFFKAKMAYFDKDSLTPFGALWKEEGYAEYIANDLPITMEEGVRILNGVSKPDYLPHFEYFKYWFAMRRLILQKNMSFEEILSSNLLITNVLEDALREKDLEPAKLYGE